jgi:DNA repair protein RecO (recombination protein O)
MTEKTKGIVLHTVKYSDSGIIVQIYTRKYGRLSFLVKGLRNRKAGRHAVFFQPLYILDLVLYYREAREVQSLKEFIPVFYPASIQSDVRKTSIALFLGEVLTSVLREESPNPGLYEYLEDSIKYFDSCPGSYSNFHIAFLSGLSGFLGIAPQRRINPDDAHFYLPEGIFTRYQSLPGNYADREISDILALFFSTSYDGSRDIPMNGELRHKVLETIMAYYYLHLPGMRKIRSIEVLKEVFR